MVNKNNKNCQNYITHNNALVTLHEHNELKERVVKLEEQTKTIFKEVNRLKESLDRNTDSVRELTTALEKERIRLSILNEKEYNENNVKQSIETGAIVGVIVLLVTEVVRFISNAL